MGRVPNRADDEFALMLLAMPAAEANAAARAAGAGATFVRVMRQRVLADDLAASVGEDPEAIRAAYRTDRGAS